MLILLLSCAPSEDFDWSAFPTCDRVLEEGGEETVLDDLPPDGTTVVCAGLHEAGHRDGVFTGDVDSYRLSFGVPVEATVTVYAVTGEDHGENEVHSYLFSEDGAAVGATADSGEALPAWRPTAGAEETLQVAGYQGVGGAYAVEVAATPLLLSGNVEADHETACTVVSEGEVLCWGENGEELSRPAPGVSSLEVGQNLVCGLGGGDGILCWDSSGGEERLDPAFVGIVASGFPAPHRCAWDAAGAVRCWSDAGDVAGAYLQFPGTGWSHVAVGEGNTCAIDSLGAVACTGTLLPPSGAFSDVSVGVYAACGLRSDDGSLQCWYDDTLSDAPKELASRVPTGQAGYEQVVVGGAYVCALRQGTVDCWGNEDYPLVVDGVPPGEHFLRISGAYDTVCGVREDGALSCWGFDRKGLVGDTP